jgi:hypothetical protein
MDGRAQRYRAMVEGAWSSQGSAAMEDVGAVSGTIIRGTLKTPNSQLVTPISIKLQRPDVCD